MGTFERCVLVCVAMVTQLGQVEGHGRMIEPASRNSMWRYGYKNPKNYNDMGLNCGGFTNQFEQQFGRCGVCGDPNQGAREHEAGGRYARGLVARAYNPGTYINVTVELTSNHMGYFEFRLCPVNDPHVKATEACLDRHVLNIVGHGRRYFISQRDTSIYVEMFVQLPANLRCSQCVMQWKWVAGQSMGPDGYGGECLGCGNQENFVNCADIAIGSAPVQPLPPPSGGFKEPEPVAPPTAAKRYKAYAAPTQTIQAAPMPPQQGPPYQVKGAGQNPGTAPVFDGTMASILSQVFQMASRANRLKAADPAPVPAAAAAAAPAPPKPVATPAPPVATPAPAWVPPPTAAPLALNQPGGRPPAMNQPPRSQPAWNQNQSPPVPAAPAWNPLPQPQAPPQWNSAAQAPPVWNAAAPKPQVWHDPVMSNPGLNNMMSGYDTAEPAWLPQQGWQQQANSWAHQSHPAPSPPAPQPTAQAFYNQPTDWNQNAAPTGMSSHQGNDYAHADYAGLEPGEYPEIPENSQPGQSNGNTGYMRGFSDAMNQLKQAGGGGYGGGKMNTALSELSVAMHEQPKQGAPGGATTGGCPGGIPRECVAGGVFAGNSEFDSMCTVSCNMGQQCPATMCSCTCPGGAGGAWGGGGSAAGCRAVDRTKGASMDTWCVQNCERNNCPSDLCVCGFST